MKTNWGKTKFQFTWKEKTSFPPALASRSTFIHPKVLFDFTQTIHPFSSAIMAGPCSAPRWAGRKTCRIGFVGGKDTALAKLPPILQRNAPFTVLRFPGVCDCIYNAHCQKSKWSIKPGSAILWSQQQRQKQPQAAFLHIEIPVARCSWGLSKCDLIEGS